MALRNPFLSSGQRFSNPFLGKVNTIVTDTTGATTKTYKVAIPVYATNGELATQEDWNNIVSTFTTTIPGKNDGKQTAIVKTYEVSHNMALPHDAPFKIYPETGINDKDGNMFFPKGQWGFGISPRNYKQYNWAFVMDSMVWNAYTVRNVSFEWIPEAGALQSGSVEVCLLDNASTPPDPYINVGPNAFSFPASQAGARTFQIHNQTAPVKNLKCVEPQFSVNGDYGIFWVKTQGFTFGDNASKVLRVGTINLSIAVFLQNTQPSSQAQLIGAWVEAGYPITPEGGDQPGTSTKLASTTGSMMLSVELSSDSVNKDAIRRNKASKPRWYRVPAQGDKAIKPLAGPSAVRAASPVAGANEATLDFPDLAQGTFDGAVTGKRILQAAADGADIGSPDAILKPQAGGDQFVAYSSVLFVNSQPEVNAALGEQENGTRVLLNYYPNASATNAHALASGDAEVPFDGNDVGKRVGVTFKTLTSFPVGTLPLAEKSASGEGAAENTVVLGWEPGEGTTLDVSREFTPEGDGNATFNSLLGACCRAAGAALSALANKNDLTITLAGVNASAVNAAGTKSAPFVGSNSNGVDATVQVQSVGLKVPDNATYRAKIGKLSGTEADIADKFFLPLPLCSTYGVTSFKPDKLTDSVARLTIAGQLNTLHTALLATYGQSLPNVAGLTYNTEVSEVMYLIGSRVDPAQDLEGFYNSAIPLTPTADSKHGTAISGPMFKQNAGTGANGYFSVDKLTTVGSQLRIGNNPLGAVASSQVISTSPCNFTIAWPDKLWDPQTQALTELQAGETMYVALLKSSAVTYSHPIVEGTGTYRFCVFPNIVPGTDKVPADQALHKYTLTLGAGSDPATTYSSVVEGAVYEETVNMMEDAERRFTLQSTTPSDNGEQQSAQRGWLRCVKKA